MHGLTIPYDMTHNYMYAQEFVRAKGLKEWQTLLSLFNNNCYLHTDWYIIIYHIYNSASLLYTWPAKKANIIYSPAGSHHEMSSLLVVVKSHLFPQYYYRCKEHNKLL